MTFEFGFDPLIFFEVTALRLKKKYHISSVFLTFVSRLTDIPLIFGTLLCHTKLQIKFKFGFDPLNFHEVMVHELRKILRIVSFLHFCCTPRLTGFEVLDSYKSKFCFVTLELFLIENTTGRGLGIACNTLRMLVSSLF
jgi:hypothetical protein